MGGPAARRWPILAALALIFLAGLPAVAADDTSLRVAALARRLDALTAGVPDIPALVAGARPSIVSLYRLDGSGQPEGFGTGFIVGQERFILTNAHVVEGAARLAVALDDGTLITGAQYLSDPISDVAIVVARLPAEVPALRPAAAPPAQGAPVVVVGNGLGLRSAAVAGIVAGTVAGGVQYPTLILNAAVQPGHSGSPVLDARGRVAGMVARKPADSAGLAYAIPYDVIQHALRLLRGGDGFVRPWLGIMARESFYAGLGLRSEAGLQVLAVASGSAAAAAGLRAGDEITGIGGQPVRSLQDLRLLLDGLAVNRPVTMAIRREGWPLALELTPGLTSTFQPGAAAGTPAGTDQGLF